MKSILKNLRRKLLSGQKTSNYLWYSLGEIFLIIVGILIAININDWVKNREDTQLRCTYQNELLAGFDYDLSDFEGNINGFNNWIPKIQELYDGLVSDSLEYIDSLNYKFGAVENFIFLAQGSKIKIEELKYSNINLIENRDLKNKILSYQEWIAGMLVLERRYDLIGEDLRKYYARNFMLQNRKKAIPVDINLLKRDNYYIQLVFQRLKMNNLLRGNYIRLVKEVKEVRTLLLKEIEKNCDLQ